MVSRLNKFIDVNEKRLRDFFELLAGLFLFSIRFLREIFADPMLVINYNSSHLGIGTRYFSLNTYNYVELTKVPDSRYLSIGPIIEILFNFYS